MPLRRKSPGSALHDNFSEGARRLWGVKLRSKLTLLDMTRMLSLPVGSVNRYLTGERLPGIKILKRIWETFRIHPLLFAEPPKRPFTPPES